MGSNSIQLCMDHTLMTTEYIVVKYMTTKIGIMLSTLHF